MKKKISKENLSPDVVVELIKKSGFPPPNWRKEVYYDTRDKELWISEVVTGGTIVTQDEDDTYICTVPSLAEYYTNSTLTPDDFEGDEPTDEELEECYFNDAWDEIAEKLAEI